MFRGLLHGLAEAAGEIVAVGKAALESDIGDGAVSAFQQISGFLAADMHQVVNRRSANTFLEYPAEVPLGEVRFSRQFVQRDFFGVVRLYMRDGITDAQ